MPIPPICGSPATLTPEQVDELQALVRAEPELETVSIGATGTARLGVALREYDVVLTELGRRSAH
jgi:hypothetical protein